MSHEDRNADTRGEQPTTPSGENPGVSPSAMPTRDAPPRRREGRGRATRRGRPDRACLNCGDPTPGEYCRSCGQRKVEVLVSVRTMIVDVLEDELAVDRRLPRTLSGLLFKPGFLTVEHVNGRIARYVRPFRLYLATSVIFFLLLSFFSLRMVGRANIGAPGAAALGAADTLALPAIDSALTEIDQLLADSALPAAAVAAADQNRRILQHHRERLLAGADTAAANDDSSPLGQPARQDRTVAELLELDESNVRSFVARTGVEAVDSALVARVRLLGGMPPQRAAERLIGDFLSYIPTVMFLLLPVFAVMLKLLYIRRRRFYAEHFVFLLHIHAFVYLVFTVLLVAQGFFSLPPWLVLLLLGWTAVYIFLALKRVYGQGWIKTYLKYLTLGWAYVLILAFSVPVALLMSILLT